MAYAGSIACLAAASDAVSKYIAQQKSKNVKLDKNLLEEFAKPEERIRSNSVSTAEGDISDQDLSEPDSPVPLKSSH